jgi:hypothetical protein
MNREPILLTLARMEQRPGITDGGGVETVTLHSDYDLKTDLPLHYRPRNSDTSACGSHTVVPRRTYYPFSYFAREGRAVCARCLRYWMDRNLKEMEE